MHVPAISSSSDAAALLAAAEVLEEAAADASSPRLVVASLVDVEATLRALDRTCLVERLKACLAELEATSGQRG